MDQQITQIIQKELNRQRNGAEMIASENFVSLTVLQTAGSVLTNKYAEGYPDKRYYGGNQFIDQAENLAIERAKKLFGAEHANVQPHSGSTANLEAYFALTELGSTILGFSLAHGGHLTHGHPVNFSGKFYNFVSYGVNKKTELIDFDEVRSQALKHKPKIILAGASAYSRQIDFEKFRQITDEINAYLMVDMAHIAGLVATKLHPDPLPVADVVTTTTHKTLRGPRGAMILCKKELAQKIDKAVFPGMQGGPLEHIIAAKAVALGEALESNFVDYQKQVLANAKTLEKKFKQANIRMISGGTDNHLLMIDVTSLGLSGKEAENLLDQVLIFTNKNMIPFDQRKPMDPSGIRLGTPALTTRGLKEKEMEIIAKIIIDTLKTKQADQKNKNKILELMKSFPLYPEL
ncbi:MAG: serine hydroxymethyltransferase [Candidatus Komeilibacteria bacterium CG11_big_fil_rev_8_21_14_0_20_36_20]|uniref:Serine hydroxymethyltransferase n=1 Tax=Candidatus Komeilibacteria bacterium CG11_big_fil_rev_8_21_14_0_20_36_20 TaxID=1974477 RepID=A0A2H0NDA5_9BACT|nr:MAG: serine hydroxymethyltransferase [Candidatus Komeilibacteria bacterium CG11_big_fil_rev_8_21_14_0_20_36_20]PIR81851.1 MAG: serine hydroxymethyltransferase [Candidatus Komeilibacteria bacterium CG10_big_fil_rev_8_21_14_0_10_36_65]PJC55059.1 MAG: serine hydroxymethyltransferase [Candidatus Komeilibacteria bacterium CG_4_9_14_0_2_um_filter_36_13]